MGLSLSDWAIWDIVQQAAREMGIENFGAHDLRRTCAKHCRKAGGDLEQIKQCAQASEGVRKKGKVEPVAAVPPGPVKAKPAGRAKAAQAERGKEIVSVGADGLGASILAARQAAGMTQMALAAKLGTSHANLIRLEKGRSIPTTTTLQKIADATGHRLEIRFRQS